MDRIHQHHSMNFNRSNQWKSSGKPSPQRPRRSGIAGGARDSCADRWPPLADCARPGAADVWRRRRLANRHGPIDAWRSAESRVAPVAARRWRAAQPEPPDGWSARPVVGVRGDRSPPSPPSMHRAPGIARRLEFRACMERTTAQRISVVDIKAELAAVIECGGRGGAVVGWDA